MALLGGILKLAIGAAEIVAGVLIPGAQFLVSLGIGTVISGIGTLLSKGPLSGTGTATRNPIAPFYVGYGRFRAGGTIVYIHEFDDDNKYLDLVIILACHPCESVDALLFDGKRVRIDANGCSFTPTQQDISISSISRSNGVVTVVTSSSITDLQDGDAIQIHDVTGDATMNGQYPVTVITSTSFSYICGGSDGSGSGGKALTTWADYGTKVYFEALLGDHSATFTGMLSGTPKDGDPGSLITDESSMPWTSAHKLLGKTCVMLRLHYNDKIFANGLPQISFHVSGKNDIYDPRVSPATYGYSENPALCIADYLSNTTFGFRATYGTEIPTADLISAANTCDEDVDLASGGTELRYTCNGGFPLTMKRGEVLQNLLTSCGGRLTYQGGQFVIHPAAWPGVGAAFPAKTITSATLSLISTHIPGTGYAGTAGGYIGAIGLFAFSTPWLYDGSSWTKRTDTTSVSGAALTALQNGTLNANFDIEGSVFGDASPPDTLKIYDCWIDVVYSDGSTGTFRPSSVSTADPGSAGSVSDSGNAIDNDPNSAATLTRHHFSGLGSPPILGLGFFVLTSSLSSPDLSSGGFTGSGTSLAMAAGPFRWRQKLAIRDLFNGVKGTFISPTNNWQSSDIPPYAQDTLHGYASGSPLYSEGDANLAADGGDRRWKDIQLPFTISVTMAQRLCKIELMRIRQQGTGTFVYNMAMYQVTALDIIQMTLPVLGWTNKILEISAHRFTQQKQNAGGQEVTLLGTEIDVQETDPSIYDWDTTEELSAQGFQHATLPTNINRLDGLTPKVSAQTGTTYVSTVADRGNLVTFNNSSPVAVVLPQGGTLSGQADELWNVRYQNIGTGTVTITPGTSPAGGTIDGQSSITLVAGRGVQIFSDGTGNFFTERGMGVNAIFVDNETPAGTSPLSTTYTLAHAPNPAASLMLYVNGVLQIPSTDFTLSSATITFTTAPDVNDIVRAFYRYQ